MAVNVLLPLTLSGAMWYLLYTYLSAKSFAVCLVSVICVGFIRRNVLGDSYSTREDLDRSVQAFVESVRALKGDVLSSAQLVEIPTMKLSRRMGGHCTVCLEPMECGETVRHLPCEHRFHVQCIDQWLLIGAHCPICKANPFREKSNESHDANVEDTLEAAESRNVHRVWFEVLLLLFLMALWVAMMVYGIKTIFISLTPLAFSVLSLVFF